MAVYNAGDEEQVKERKLQGRFNRKRKLAVVKELMGTADGRTFVHEFLGLCHLYVAVAGPDTHMTYFKDGERNVGLRLVNDLLEASPELYLKMLQEAQERIARDAGSTMTTNSEATPPSAESSTPARCRRPLCGCNAADGGTQRTVRFFARQRTGRPDSLCRRGSPYSGGGGDRTGTVRGV